MIGEVSKGVKEDMDVDREVKEDIEMEACSDTVILLTMTIMKLTHGQK